MSNKLVEISEDSARGRSFLFTGNALPIIILAVDSILVAKLLRPENHDLYSINFVAPSILLLSTDFDHFMAEHQQHFYFRAK